MDCDYSMRFRGQDIVYKITDLDYLKLRIVYMYSSTAENNLGSRDSNVS
jgi:hypothetical protein